MRQKRPSSKDLNKLVNTFTVYKFIKDMTTPFEEMEWFSKGFIDKEGEYLKDNKDIPIYYRLIINLKRLIDQIPNPSIKAKSKNLTTAISLYAEDIERLGGNSDVVLNEIFAYLESRGLDLTEEMTVSGGNISGVSPNPDNPDNLPDVFLSKKAQKKYVKGGIKNLFRRKEIE